MAASSDDPTSLPRLKVHTYQVAGGDRRGDMAVTCESVKVPVVDGTDFPVMFFRWGSVHVDHLRQYS